MLDSERKSPSRTSVGLVGSSHPVADQWESPMAVRLMVEDQKQGPMAQGSSESPTRIVDGKVLALTAIFRARPYDRWRRRSGSSTGMKAMTEQGLDSRHDAVVIRGRGADACTRTRRRPPGGRRIRVSTAGARPANCLTRCGEEQQAAKMRRTLRRARSDAASGLGRRRRRRRGSMPAGNVRPRIRRRCGREQRLYREANRDPAKARLWRDTARRRHVEADREKVRDPRRRYYKAKP